MIAHASTSLQRGIIGSVLHASAIQHAIQAMCTSCSVNFCACWRFIDNMVRGAHIFRQSSAPLHVTQMRRAVSQRLLLIEIYCERLFTSVIVCAVFLLAYVCV